MSRARSCDCVPVDGLTIVDGVVHGDVALERDAHGHEDGGGHGDGEEGEQEVREQDEVQLGRQLMREEREKNCALVSCTGGEPGLGRLRFGDSPGWWPLL